MHELPRTPMPSSSPKSTRALHGLCTSPAPFGEEGLEKGRGGGKNNRRRKKGKVRSVGGGGAEVEKKWREGWRGDDERPNVAKR